MDDICLVGSSVLADFGVRDNRDLDIAIDPRKRGLLDIDNTPENVEVALEKYSWLGITDHDLINNSRYHYKSGGIKIVRPEVCYSFKHRRKKDKDIYDIELINEGVIYSNDYDWDWELFSYEYYPGYFGKRGLPYDPSHKYSLLARLEMSYRNEGLYNTIIAISSFLRDRTPFLSGDSTHQKQETPNTTSNQFVYFIIWPTVSDYFKSITGRIDSHLEVVATEKLPLDTNISAFVDDLYSFDHKDRHLIDYKKYKIQQDGDEVLVVKSQMPITDSGDADEEFLSSFKNKVRREYFPYVPNDSFHNIFHGSDSVKENEQIRRVVDQYK